MMVPFSSSGICVACVTFLSFTALFPVIKAFQSGSCPSDNQTSKFHKVILLLKQLNNSISYQFMRL